MIHSHIAGTGSYLPKKILTNAELESMVILPMNGYSLAQAFVSGI